MVSVPFEKILTMKTAIQCPKKMYVFFYEQVNKADASVRHINLGKHYCMFPEQTSKWQTMELLEERCRGQTPWLVRSIGAMPIDMYERHKFADYNQQVYMTHYDNP